MGYLALYRKYRPDNFDEVVGQDKIVNVIKNEIINNKVSHAYLFSGPRGTGKTTTAKIIAKLVNCQNLNSNGDCCDKCNNCLNFKNNSDIVEIDAASNNGVDEIRELRDKVSLVPSNSKYKVYIIDEVHMLTTQAFNALLKTLEEPPSHVIFILATTEYHKVPLTISSRCQKFRFSKITVEIISKRLKQISVKEKINIKDDVLNEISRISDGGMRDAINLLDQLIAYKENNITLEDVYNISGNISYVDLYNFILNLRDNKVSDILDYVDKIKNDGKNLSKFIEELLSFLKDVLLYKCAGIANEIIDKNEKIKIISDNFSEEIIYKLIFSYNDILNNIKNSNDVIILFIVGTLKIISDNFSNKKSIEKVNLEESNIIKNNFGTQKLSKSEFNDNNVNNLSDEFVSIRINNTFALANKNDLNMIKDKWNLLNNKIVEGEDSLNCGILVDSFVVAAGKNYLIISSKFNSIIDKINSKLDSFEKTLFNLLSKKFYIIGIYESNWEREKEKYINNIKNGYQYNLIEELEKDTISEKNKSPVDQLVDLIGEDLIVLK